MHFSNATNDHSTGTVLQSPKEILVTSRNGGHPTKNMMINGNCQSGFGGQSLFNRTYSLRSIYVDGLVAVVCNSKSRNQRTHRRTRVQKWILAMEDPAYTPWGNSA